MGIINTVGNIIDRCIRMLVIALVAVMSGSILLQVFCRYFLNNPLVWSEELARFCLIWITFFGATVALHSNSLVSVDLLVEKLPDIYKKIILTLNYVFMIAMCGFLLYLSLKLLVNPSVTMQKSSALRIPMTYVYFCLPASFGLMLLQLIIKIVKSLHKKEVTPE